MNSDRSKFIPIASNHRLNLKREFQFSSRPVRTALRSASDRAITAFQSLHERFRKKDPVPHENRGDQDEESSAKNH